MLGQVVTVSLLAIYLFLGALISVDVARDFRYERTLVGKVRTLWFVLLTVVAWLPLVFLTLVVQACWPDRGQAQPQDHTDEMVGDGC